ncbi:RhuM family protein [Sorangium sp. So ce385]
MTDQTPQEGDLILYRTADDVVRVEVLYEAKTFWLDQRRVAELFGVDVRMVSYHLKEGYASGELTPEATLRRIWRVQREGNREVSREIEFYNLDAIISVGYRVNSTQATQFRIWATQTLREFIVKGFVLDDERLKLNKRFGKDYFDELLERIREIRASERRFYLKITDIYKQGVRAHCVDVSRLCREPGRAPDPDEDGGLGREARRVPAVQRVRGARERRQGLRGVGQAPRRRAVRQVPRAAGPRVRERLRG